MRAVTVLAAAAAAALWFAQPAKDELPRVDAIAFSPGGEFLAAAFRHGGVTVWRVQGFVRAGGMRLEETGANALAFSPDAQLLAVAGRSLHIRGPRDWKESVAAGRPRAVYGTARFSPDGRLLATVDSSERIDLWDLASGRIARTLCCMALYGDLAFSPDGRVLAAGGHRPRLWDPESGREVRRLVETREPTFGPVAFRPDGKVLATGSQDGRVRLWEVETGRESMQATPRRSYVESLAFHPGGTLLAYAVRGGAAWIWDIAAGYEREVAPLITSNVAFSHDGRWLAAGIPGGKIRVWDVAARHANGIETRCTLAP